MDRADHRSAKDGHLGHHRHALKLKVVRKHDMAADVGEHRQRSGSDDGAADGQSVQAIGKVYRIRRAHQDEDNKDDEGHKGEKSQMRQRCRPEMPQQVGPELLEEWDSQLRGKHTELLQNHERDGNQGRGQSPARPAWRAP